MNDMDQRVHLHEGEELLLQVRPAAILFVRDILRSLLEAFLVGVVGGVLAGLFFQMSVTAILIVIWIVVGLLLVLLRYRHWTHAELRVTTERILIQAPHALLPHPLRTIKWPQYQESFLGNRGPFDLLFGVRTLTIRYGNADSKLFLSFPGLRFANDIKHYLDKVDSAVRHNQAQQMHAFIFKKRGQRDEA